MKNGSSMIQDADNMLNLLKDIIKQELDKCDKTVVCRIVRDNKDGTYDIYAEPDENNIIHGIPALSTTDKLYTGDFVYVFKINNNFASSFILKTIGK